MKPKKFTCYDVFVNLISLATFVIDIGTDILVIVEFYEKNHVVWGSLSVVFVLLPAVVMQFFSVKWYHNDGKLTFFTFLPHLFLLGPVFRYLGVIKVGLRARHKSGDVTRDTSSAFSQQNDISILRLIEAFMESAPQLVLHLYIVLSRLHIDWLTGISLASSLVSLSWALTAYTDALRLAYQKGYTRRWLGLVVHSLWRTFMASARVMALVLFAVAFKAWIFLVAGTHWLVMTIMISVQGTDFGDGYLETSMFRLVAGFIHVFCFLNVKDGRTRFRVAAFYFLIFLENTGMWTLWYIYTDTPELVVVTAFIVFGAFMLGLVFLLVYYRFLHPSGPVHLFMTKPPVYQPTIMPPARPKRERERDEVFNMSDSILDYNQSCNANLDLSQFSPPGARSPFVHSASNTPGPQNATDRNLRAIWESSSQLALNSTVTNCNTQSGHVTNGNSNYVTSRNSNHGDVTNKDHTSVAKGYNNHGVSSACQMSRTESRSSDSNNEVIYAASWVKPKDPDYSIVFNEGTDGLMFRIRSQKEEQGSDCSPYSVTSLSTLNSKPGSLSPLDAHKLWEESKRRMMDCSLSSPSSTNTRKSLFENREICRVSRTSMSSTSSSQFFNDHNDTVREATCMPPLDQPYTNHYDAPPIFIQTERSAISTQNVSATIPVGSVLKLNNSSINTFQWGNEHVKGNTETSHPIKGLNTESNEPVSSRKLHVGYNELETNENREFKSTFIHFDKQNPKCNREAFLLDRDDGHYPVEIPNCTKMEEYVDSPANNTHRHVSFANKVEVAPQYSRFNCSLSSFQPSIQSIRSNYESWNMSSPYSSSHGTPASPHHNTPASSLSSPNSTDEPVTVNSSFLSGNACCSPNLPFIDESGSDSGSVCSSGKQPCSPKTCYMSAITQLADEEVAETLENGKTNSNEISQGLTFNNKITENQTSHHEDSKICPPSYDVACQRSKVFSSSCENSHLDSKRANLNIVGVDPSSLPISVASRPADTAWRLDYLNIEPSPSLKYVPDNCTIPGSKYSSRLNLSDPGYTAITLQQFDDSPWKFGRNIDLFKKGTDWESTDFRQSLKKQTVEKFPITVLEDSPYSHTHQSEEPQRQSRERNSVDPNGLSPPLKSSSQNTSLARKRSLSRRNSLHKTNENDCHYAKAQNTGSKFSGIKRHSDYVQYGKLAEKKQSGGILGQRNHGNKTPRKLENKNSFSDNRGPVRQPFRSLENSPGFIPHSERKSTHKTHRFSVTPQKTTSLYTVSGDDIMRDKPIRKWAPADLNKSTPEGKSRNNRRKTSFAHRPKIVDHHISKARSMEHLY